MKYVDLGAQLHRIRADVDARIAAVLSHGQYVGGSEVGELESALSAYVGVGHCIGVGNGTDALTIALRALGVQAGDDVFVPSFTFFASAEAISLAGATPRFVDVDPSTFNIDLESLARAVDAAAKPRGVLAVDMYGLPADYPLLEAFCKERGLFLLEDAAQSFGALISDRRAGSFGTMAATSFFPAKPLGCYGDGGAIFTDDAGLAALARSLAVHGKGEHKYDNVRIGTNSRLDTIQAAVLLAKLEVFEDELQRRQQVAEAYSTALANHVTTPVVPDGFRSAWAQYTIRTPDRDRLAATLREQGIPAVVYYPTAVHQQPAYAVPVFLPATETLVSEVLSLPFHPYLELTEIEAVVAGLVRAL